MDQRGQGFLVYTTIACGALNQGLGFVPRAELSGAEEQMKEWRVKL
jgi:hypothetical protein